MNRKYMARILSFVLCIMVCISMFAVTFSAASSAVLKTTAEIRFRSSPEFSDSNIITVLSKGEKLTLVADSKDGWANVKRSDGTKGYCSVDYLDLAEGSSAEIIGKTTDEVNFRKGPSTDYDVISYLYSDTEFTVTDNSNEYWVKSLVNGNVGYIYRSYTELSINLPAGGSEDTKPQEPDTQPTTETQPATETQPPVTEPQEQKPLEPPRTPNWYSSSLLDTDNTYKGAEFLGDCVLDKSELNLETGRTYNLSVLALGTSLDNSASFESSDTNVATVDKGGRVLALTAGEATITATVNGKKYTCTVNVTGEPYTPVVPTEPVTEPATTPASTPAVTEPSTEPDDFKLSQSSATMEKGNMLVLTSPYKNTAWSTFDSKIALVDNGLVTATGEGKVKITAEAEGKTAFCDITVVKTGTGLTIEYSDIDIPMGKTFFNDAYSIADITWTSSDSSVAEVTNGFITAKAPGTAVITASSQKGTKTCFVNVGEPEAVRFAYAYPNTAAKDEEITLVAITDKNRQGVQFKIDVNGDTKTVDATSKKADGNTIVWTGTTTLSTAGTFKVSAFSKYGNKYQTCDNGKTTVFVRETKDLVKESQETRRVSDDMIELLAGFEGYVGNVYFDNLAGGLPTLGYGKVVYVGDVFYNDMTKTEAYAQLYDTVNNGGYSSSVNSYLKSLNANYNQQQFDSLVSLAYNIGYYGLKSDSEIRALILDSFKKPEVDEKDKKSAYVNDTQINLRSGPGTEHDSLGWLSYPDTLTLLDEKLVNNNWYHVKTADGREGYMYKDYVTLGVPVTEGDIYLSLIDRSEYTRVILEYHHAGSVCIWGLLSRRVDELDVFYYGDYDRDGSENRFGYSYTCYKNNSFTL